MMEPKAIVDAIHAAKALWNTTWAFFRDGPFQLGAALFLLDIAD